MLIMDKDWGASEQGKKKLKEKRSTMKQEHLIDFKSIGYEKESQ